MKRLLRMAYGAVLGVALGGGTFVCASAQVADGGAPSLSDLGADLGALVSVDVGTGTPDLADIRQCDGLFDTAEVTGISCALDLLRTQFQHDDLVDRFEGLFTSRFGEHSRWEAVAGLFSPAENAVTRATLADYANGTNCDAFQDIGGGSLVWAATPEGLRDLSPPIAVPPTSGRALVDEALIAGDAVALFLATPCTSSRLIFATHVFFGLLSQNRVEEALALARSPFMPKRYERQGVGASQDANEQGALTRGAVEAVISSQSNLSDPAAAQEEIATVLSEVDRQFEIDFLLGRLWSLDRYSLNALEFDLDFVGQVARLMSQDARLLQQGYSVREVRLFYPDFFTALVEKRAFGLMRGIDLLVPEAIAVEFNLALSSQPIEPTTPTRFERDQDILAILIAAGESAAVLNVWDELSVPQQTEAVLFALDQGQLAVAQTLFSALDEEGLSLDFAIRLTLYLLANFLETVDQNA